MDKDTPRQIREKLGFSIDEMAQVCGVHRQTWVKWERGEREMSNAAKRLIGVFRWLDSNDLLDICTKDLKKKES